MHLEYKLITRDSSGFEQESAVTRVGWGGRIKTADEATRMCRKLNKTAEKNKSGLSYRIETVEVADQ